MNGLLKIVFLNRNHEAFNKLEKAVSCRPSIFLMLSLSNTQILPKMHHNFQVFIFRFSFYVKMIYINTLIFFYEIPLGSRSKGLKRPDSVENILLDRKILIGHCKGHDTTILIILIDGLKEKTIRLYNKEVCC